MTRNLGTKISIALELIKALAVMAILVIGALTLYGHKETKELLKNGLCDGDCELSLKKVREQIGFIKKLLLKRTQSYDAASFHFVKQGRQSVPDFFASLLVKGVRPTLAPPTIS